MEYHKTDQPGQTTAEWEQLLAALTRGVSDISLALQGLRDTIERLGQMRPTFEYPAAADTRAGRPEIAAADAEAPAAESAPHLSVVQSSTRAQEPAREENAAAAGSVWARPDSSAPAAGPQDAPQAGAGDEPAAGAGEAPAGEAGRPDSDAVREEVRQAVARARAEMEGSPPDLPKPAALDWSHAEPRPWALNVRELREPPPTLERHRDPERGPAPQASPGRPPAGQTSPDDSSASSEMPASSGETEDIEGRAAAAGAEDVRHQVRRAVETARAELATQPVQADELESGPGVAQDRPPAQDPASNTEASWPSRNKARVDAAPLPMPAAWESLAQAHTEDRFATIIPTIVIEDPSGRVELVRVYDTLANLDCAITASLANYMPHSVTITIATDSLPAEAEIQHAVESAFRRSCRVTVDGNRATVRLADSGAGRAA